MTDSNSQEWGAEMDVAEHERTYDGFVAFTKYGTISMAVLLVLMAVFLV